MGEKEKKNEKQREDREKWCLTNGRETWRFFSVRGPDIESYQRTAISSKWSISRTSRASKSEDFTVNFVCRNLSQKILTIWWYLVSVRLRKKILYPLYGYWWIKKRNIWILWRKKIRIWFELAMNRK